MIQKEFVPYEEALALKELGFDEPCFAVYFNPTQQLYFDKYINEFNKDVRTLAPTFSQAFRWFREKCDLHAVIMPKTTPSNTTVYYVYKGKFEEDWNNCFETYEEAELECLKRLIKLTNEQQIRKIS